MKKLTILLFSILISFNSYGEWVEVAKDTDGDTFYIETSAIKERNGYVYYWTLADFVIPVTGFWSSKMYKQGECGINRFKVLSMLAYKQSMGKGDNKEIRGDDKWHYPEPDNVKSTLLNYACNYVK
jgi:hypothetical protein